MDIYRNSTKYYFLFANVAQSMNPLPMADQRPILHLEISSKCALQCPYCPRTLNPGKFEVRDMDLDMIRNIIGVEKFYQNIALCGAHGDPIYHADFHNVIDYLKTLTGTPKININTNGSHRSREWWVRTAGQMRRRDTVTFGIDGLEDTNHLYRKNADWKSVMMAIETLKEHSIGRVEWQWILFRHNQHQLREGAQLARDLGIDRFFVVESFRGNGDLEPTLSMQEAMADIV